MLRIWTSPGYSILHKQQQNYFKGWITMRYTTAYLKIKLNSPIKMYYYYVSIKINFWYILFG